MECETSRGGQLGIAPSLPERELFAEKHFGDIVRVFIERDVQRSRKRTPRRTRDEERQHDKRPAQRYAVAGAPSGRTCTPRRVQYAISICAFSGESDAWQLFACLLSP